MTGHTSGDDLHDEPTADELRRAFLRGNAVTIIAELEAKIERYRQLLRRVLEHSQPCMTIDGHCHNHDCSTPCVYVEIRKELEQ